MPDRHSARDQERLARVIAHHGIATVFDVGANVGQYGDKLRRMGYAGRIISFEPIASCHAELTAAAAADDNWLVMPAMALGAKEGSISINRSAESDMSSMLEFNAEMADLLDSSHFVGTETVQMRRLDKLLPDYASRDEPVMLKIDTQGYEQAVLDGASGVIDRLDLIQLELSLFEIYEGEPDWREMTDHLADLGFEPVLLIPGYFNKRTARMLQMDGVFARMRGTR